MEGRWRIKEFASRTGVPEATLRAWEKRYDLLEPTRSDGGYRLYSPADERRVVAMQAHMGRGIAASEAAGLVRAEGLPAGDVPHEPAALSEALLVAVEAYDATRVDALLEATFALGRTVAIRDVLIPVLHEIGDRWERGSVSVAQEHFATHLIERRLMQQAAGWGAGSGPLALLACPSGERHTLGLLCFGVILAERGWRVAYLGADTPIGHLREAAESLGPDVIVLSAIDSTYLTDNAPLIKALSTAFRTVVAGAGATEAVAGRLGVDRIGADPVSAADAL